MAKSIKKIVLPFTVPDKDRFKPFTKDMEMASIFILAERDRKKGEGRVLKKAKEKFTFIAETCYPIWLIPWKGKTLVFDGLEFTNHKIFYDSIPDFKTFETDLLASSKSREAYVAALSQNASYFQKFTGKEEKTIEGLITNPQLVQDLMVYFKDSKDNGISKTSKAILSPMLDEQEVTASIDKLSNLRTTIDHEIKNLGKCMKLLSKTSRLQIKTQQAEMRKSVKDFDTKIKKLKPGVMARIKKIQEKRDEDVTKISKEYSRKLRSLQQKRVRAEKALERLTSEIERVEAGIKVCRERKDEANEFQLSQKLNVLKKKIPSLNKEIKDTDRELENVEDAKKIDVTRARMKPDDSIEEAMKVLHNVEAEKEAKVRVEQQELTYLEEMTSAIIKQIDSMIKSKENALNEIDNLAAEERRLKWTIAYLPIYFICYESDEGKRYVTYPPSHVCTLGIKTKLKSVFGSGKMKCLLQSRSDAIAALLDRLVDLTQENPVFEKEIIQAGLKANILHSTELWVGVKRGIRELKDEGWISDSEVQIRNEQT